MQIRIINYMHNISYGYLSGGLHVISCINGCIYYLYIRLSPVVGWVCSFLRALSTSYLRGIFRLAFYLRGVILLASYLRGTPYSQEFV